jgi:hypothetical protein
MNSRVLLTLAIVVIPAGGRVRVAQAGAHPRSQAPVASTPPVNAKPAVPVEVKPTAPVGAQQTPAEAQPTAGEAQPTPA